MEAMSAERLREIEERLAALDDGPECRACGGTGDAGARRCFACNSTGIVTAAADAIADHASTDVRDLANEVRRLQRERDERTRRARVALERLGVADCDDVLDGLDAAVDDCERREREAAEELRAAALERDDLNNLASCQRDTILTMTAERDAWREELLSAGERAGGFQAHVDLDDPKAVGMACCDLIDQTFDEVSDREAERDEARAEVERLRADGRPVAREVSDAR